VPVTEREVTIGRGTDCVVVLPSVAVSRKHASIQQGRDGRTVINDEGSANGVKVDGQLISGPTLVDESNRIQISEFALSLETEPVEMPPPRAPPPRGPTAPRPAAQRDGWSPVTAPSPVGTAELERDARAADDVDTDEGLESDTVLEARSGAGAALADCTLQLVGRGGPYDGTVFKLDKPLLGIGRGKENEIALEDPSISRRHAQIRLSVSATRFTVLDLRSSNGTYVDGARVKRAECGETSVVRFGDLAFKVTVERRTAIVPTKKRSTRARLILGGLVVLAVLGGVGVVAYLKRPKPVVHRDKTPEERLREMQAEVQGHVDKGRRHFALHEWSAAVRAFDEALGKDPLNAESRRLRETAMQEVEHEKIYRKGLEFFSLSNRENLIKAKEIFVKVPASSYYHREVRYRIKTIDERVAQDYRIEGVSQCNAKQYERCHASLCKFFGHMPADTVVTNEAYLRTTLQDLEKRFARRKGFEPCRAKRFLDKGSRDTGASDPAVLLEEKYELSEVREVLLLYIEGKLDSALKKLAHLKQNRALRPSLDGIKEVDRQLLIIRGKYVEGISAHRERNVQRAHKEWGVLLAADRALVPEKIESFYRREVTRALADLYYDLGDEQFKAGRFRQTFELWSKGKQVDPRNGRLLNGMLQLEKKSEALIREGRAMAAGGNISDGRAKLSTARDIVEDGRPIRKEALKALAELGD
jgi:pSer/pThr/pTyr-binding forkhead associated (FHA) protein/tetratricopeptide (TPR) repeat protein